MSERLHTAAQPFPHLVKALGEEPLFKVGDGVKIAVRFPVGHYRVPRYIRGKHGVVEAVIEPAAIDNEEEAFGRNPVEVTTTIAFLRGFCGGMRAPKDGCASSLRTWLERLETCSTRTRLAY